MRRRERDTQPMVGLLPHCLARPTYLPYRKRRKRDLLALHPRRPPAYLGQKRNAHRKGKPSLSPGGSHSTPWRAGANPAPPNHQQLPPVQPPAHPNLLPLPLDPAKDLLHLIQPPALLLDPSTPKVPQLQKDPLLGRAAHLWCDLM